MLKVYTIYSPDKKWRAEISARLGANIVKLQFENKNILNPFISEQQYNENPFIVGSPMLFPANRTYNGKFEFQGKQYYLPVNDSLNVANLHGMLYSVCFDMMEFSSDKIVLYYQNNGEIYPFKFKIIVEYSLDNEGLEQIYRIENIGDIDMPFTFALHTTFIEPKNFMVPIDLCQQKNERHILQVNISNLISKKKSMLQAVNQKALKYPDIINLVETWRKSATINILYQIILNIGFYITVKVKAVFCVLNRSAVRLTD